MIKGHSIEGLFILSDTTTGQMAIWFMIIMLLGIYIIYQCTYLYWSAKKIERFKEYQKIIKKGPDGICYKEKTNKKITKIPKERAVKGKTSAFHSSDEEEMNEDAFEDEVMEVFNNLRKRERHLF